MTEGGLVSGSSAPRLRIKGRAASVTRFFSISVAFTVLWILVTSQLGHYSKLFGPQILLQLNLAFYLPSIPVLLLSGSLERALDERVGPIGSITLRLNTGLGGCLLLAALFPLLPGLKPGDGPLWPLLTATAVLGSLSAVAFSTSYQLVQFFRAADTIGLGVGCVGSGPLVLLVQLALGVGPSPARWQWIAMYEISAGLIAAGLASSSSLCGQYWVQLNESASRGAAAAAAAAGEGGGEGGGRVPLLAAAAAADAAAADEAAAAGDLPPLAGGGSPTSPYVMRAFGSGGLRARGRLVSRRPTTAPDPFNVFNLLTPGLDGGFDWAADGDNDSAPPVLLRRSASAGVERGAAARRRREALAAAGLDRSSGGTSRTGATLASQYAIGLPSAKPHTPPTSPAIPTTAAAGAAGAASHSAPAWPTPSPIVGMASAPATLTRPAGARKQQMPEVQPPPAAAAAAGTSAGTSDLEFGIPDEVPLVQLAADDGITAVLASPERLPYTSASSFATPSASVTLAAALQAAEGEGAAVYGGRGAGGEAAVALSADAAAEAEAREAAEVEAAEAEAKEAAEAEAAEVMTVHQEVVEVVRGAWQVLLGFLVSVTTLYIVFPFFTYVPTSGWLGDSLPQVLFYARLFTDLAGRLLPRRRALQLRSGAAVLTLAAVSTAAAALFFAYILAPQGLVWKAPGLLRNDVVPLVLVVFLWLSGGYTNTISNMLAPSLVSPDLAGRASAVMALLFNVAHIGGLVIAAAMAAAIFGDVVG